MSASNCDGNGDIGTDETDIGTVNIDCSCKRNKTVVSKSGISAIQHQQKNTDKKVQVGKDQEKAQSEKDSHSKNRGGKKPN